MKRLESIWFLCMCLSGAVIVGAQTSNATAVVFPANTTEFSVVFPRAPRVQTIYVEGGLTGKQAELITNESLLRAELVEINDEQASNVAKLSESQRVEIALAYARANGIANAAVVAGVNDLGRFAKLRGNKVIEGVSATYEAIFIWGTKQAITLTVGGVSSGFPQRSITTFLNSVKSSSQPVVPRNLNISVSQSRLSFGASTVELPISRSGLFRILGTPSRETPKLNTIYSWDDAGVIAYEKPGSGLIHQVSVVFNNTDMNYDFFSRRVFSGTLVVDGIPMFASAKSKEINSARSQRLFSSVSGLPFLRKIQLGSLNVTAEFASDSNYREDGKLIEVSIEVSTS